MKDSTKGLVQQFMAALWTAASAHDTTPVGERIVGLVELVNEAEAQLAGLRLRLLHEAQLSAAATVVDQVRSSVRATPAQATATLRLATDLGERFDLIGAALSEGLISLAQAEAIVAGMKKLPARLTRTELVECQELILAHTDTLGPAELRVLAVHLSEVINPDQADTDDATRLAREERAAHRDRFLRLAPDYHGSIRITGQLRVADAELLSAQLDALMPAASTYQHTGQAPSRDARRADALVLLTHTVAKSSTLLTHGGNRPQVHITVNLDTLTTGLGEEPTRHRQHRRPHSGGGPPPGLRRASDPHRPGHPIPATRRRPHPPPVHLSHPHRTHPPRPGLRLPRLHRWPYRE